MGSCICIYSFQRIIGRATEEQLQNMIQVLDPVVIEHILLIKYQSSGIYNVTQISTLYIYSSFGKIITV